MVRGTAQIYSNHFVITILRLSGDVVSDMGEGEGVWHVCWGQVFVVVYCLSPPGGWWAGNTNHTKANQVYLCALLYFSIWYYQRYHHRMVSLVLCYSMLLWHYVDNNITWNTSWNMHFSTYSTIHFEMNTPSAIDVAHIYLKNQLSESVLENNNTTNNNNNNYSSSSSWQSLVFRLYTFLCQFQCLEAQ